MRQHSGKLRGILLPPGGGLRIGGIEIAISAPVTARLRVSNPLYRPFLSGSGAVAGGPRISVRVFAQGWPKLLDEAATFDTGDSWTLHRHGDRYWIQLAPAGCSAPLWIARLERDASRVALYCRPAANVAPDRETIDLPLVYPLDQLLMMHYLARRRGMLAHAAGIVIAGKAYLFAGVSGAGKSTFSLLLAAARAGRMLSDERVIVRAVRGGLTAFGTPWAGTANIASPASAPLAGIFLLKHGKANRIEPLEPVAAADRMRRMIAVPWYDPDAAAPIIAFVRKACASVPVNEFRFTPDCSAVAFLKKHLKAGS